MTADGRVGVCRKRSICEPMSQARLIETGVENIVNPAVVALESGAARLEYAATTTDERKFRPFLVGATYHHL